MMKNTITTINGVHYVVERTFEPLRDIMGLRKQDFWVFRKRNVGLL